MFKYKQLIIGFIIGAVMFSLAPVSAAIEEFILYKTDYKIMIDGKEYISVDKPILNYQGTTYGPLRPMLEAAGLNVEWNVSLSQAEVTAPPQAQSTIESEVMTLPETPAEQITQTPDGITQIDTWEDKQYIGTLYVRNRIRENGYDFVKIRSTSSQSPLTYGTYNTNWQIIKNGEIILDNIPIIFIYGYDAVEINYYINTVLPLIK